MRYDLLDAHTHSRKKGPAQDPAYHMTSHLEGDALRRRTELGADVPAVRIHLCGIVCRDAG